MDHASAYFEPWSYETEVRQLQSFDIFLSPLRDTPWEQGKCGLKTLTAMSAGLPVIASAVGVHKEIIQDGVNGFLAKDLAEWRGIITHLITEDALRAKVGAEARKTIKQSYDLSAMAPRLMSLISND